MSKLYRLEPTSQDAFAAWNEVYPGLQFGGIGGRSCLVVHGLVAVPLDDSMQEAMVSFYEEVWGEGCNRRDKEDIEKRYDRWLGSLDGVAVTPEPIERPTLAAMVLAAAAANPPPPPHRHSLVPGGLHPPGGPPNVYGHLPFATQTMPNEVFYRCEAWPTSVRLVGTTIKQGTFASPESELPFLQTGFAAVARNALPSFFPACFQYTLTPKPVGIRCGAVVPMFGQSGGGVEVVFMAPGQNSTHFAPNVIPPL